MLERPEGGAKESQRKPIITQAMWGQLIKLVDIFSARIMHNLNFMTLDLLFF